jgi:hypothetical protein
VSTCRRATRTCASRSDCASGEPVVLVARQTTHRADTSNPVSTLI